MYTPPPPPRPSDVPAHAPPVVVKIVTLRPRTNPSDLTAIFRRAASVILQEGGVVRSIANHGVRVLPYRFHSRHDLKEDDKRWFSSGRWASAYYDASPGVAERMEVGFRRGRTGRGGAYMAGRLVCGLFCHATGVLCSWFAVCFLLAGVLRHKGLTLSPSRFLCLREAGITRDETQQE